MSISNLTSAESYVMSISNLTSAESYVMSISNSTSAESYVMSISNLTSAERARAREETDKHQAKETRKSPKRKKKE